MIKKEIWLIPDGEGSYMPHLGSVVMERAVNLESRSRINLDSKNHYYKIFSELLSLGVSFIILKLEIIISFSSNIYEDWMR